MEIIYLDELKDTTIIIREGTFYGCVQDENGNIIKKGFDDRDEARRWIADKVEYQCRWTE